MTKPYPDDPFLTGYFAPLGVECDAPDLVVDGELPADLAGTYYPQRPGSAARPTPR
jgi:carotenoid cleavage dioxygenase-like enzyme